MSRDSVQQPFDHQDSVIIPREEASGCETNSDKDSSSFSRRTLSWHEHVYRKLTNKPTPHLIENILGIAKAKPLDDDRDVLHQRMALHAEDPPDSKLPRPVQDTNEPLNLSIKSDAKVRTKVAKGTSPQIGPRDSIFRLPRGYFR